MGKSLKCIFINVCSLVSRYRRHYLQDFVKEERPDVLMLAEHRLSPRHVFELKGYRTFRQNRINGNGGGTAVCIREEIKGERVPLDIGNIEGTIVRIRDGNGSSIFLCSLYLRPQDRLNPANLDTLNSIIGSSDVIIGSDLNSRHPYWGGNIANTNGRALYDWLSIHPTLDVRCTMDPTHDRSFIDIFITSIGLTPVSGNLEKPTETLDYDSDHRAIKMEVTTGDLERAEVILMYDYAKMDAKIFDNTLASRLEESPLPPDANLTIEDIDTAVDTLTEAYGTAIEASVPKMRPSNGILRDLPDNIMKLLKEQKTMRRRERRAVDPNRKLTIKAEIKNVKKITKELITIHDEDVKVQHFRKVESGPSMFSEIRRFGHLSKRKKISTIIDRQNRPIEDDKSKAECFATKFSEIQTSRVTEPQDSPKMRKISALRCHQAMVQFSPINPANGTVSINSPLKFATRSEVGNAIRTLNRKKSAGIDGVPNYVLRRTGPRSWEYLTVLINNCINIGYFPKKWKHAKVIPVPKPGKDPTLAENYRPIALLSNIGKLFELIIQERVRTHLEEKEVLGDFQFGFRSGLSTGHALMAFADNVVKGLNTKRPTIAVSLDFEKAFDTVWQEGIVYKMHEVYGFDKSLSRLIYDYLIEREFMVAVGEFSSRTIATMAGVPQGSILGPILFNIYLADIPRPETGEEIYVYADDILVAASNAKASFMNRNLNRYLEKLGGYFSEWYMKLNTPKCECLMIKGIKRRICKSARSYVPNIVIGGDVIKNTQAMKYLGVTFDEKWKFGGHIEDVLLKAKKAFGGCSAILSSKRGLSQRIRMTIYKQIVRPVISYAFPIWFNISSHMMERLRLAERRVLRHCLDLRTRMGADGSYHTPSCRAVYEKAQLERLDVWMAEMAIRTLEKYCNNEGNLVKRTTMDQEEFNSLLEADDVLAPMDLLNLKEYNKLYVNNRLFFYHRRYRQYDLYDTVYNTAQ